MYVPTFSTKKNGVPILSKEEIDIIAENYVRDFQPEVLAEPKPIDVEGFIEYYLGMTTDYQYLSHNGIYLGMTVFNDTDRVPIYSPEKQRAEYISARARTVIIDNQLLEESQTHRYRFTLGHEGGHDIFHTAYFNYNPAQTTLFVEPASPPMVQCRRDCTQGKPGGLRTDNDWMEWQANCFSSAFLMPSTSVQLVAQRHSSCTGKLHDYLLVQDVASIFDVSREAATYRLQGLGLISQDFSVPVFGGTFESIIPATPQATIYA